MTTYTQRRNEVNLNTVDHLYAILDSKGRELGAKVETCEVDFTLEDGRNGGYAIAPGHYYAVRVNVTRNKVAYGASQGWEYFETRTQRDARIAKRLKDTKADADKKVLKVDGFTYKFEAK